MDNLVSNDKESVKRVTFPPNWTVVIRVIVAKGDIGDDNNGEERVWTSWVTI
jgi:hypothetical protein